MHPTDWPLEKREGERSKSGVAVLETSLRSLEIEMRFGLSPSKISVIVSPLVVI